MTQYINNRCTTYVTKAPLYKSKLRQNSIGQVAAILFNILKIHGLLPESFCLGNRIILEKCLAFVSSDSCYSVGVFSKIMIIFTKNVAVPLEVFFCQKKFPLNIKDIFKQFSFNFFFRIVSFFFLSVEEVLIFCYASFICHIVGLTVVTCGLLAFIFD